MKIINALLHLFAPDICVSCNKEGSVLCEVCSISSGYPDRCYVCKKPSPSSLTCQKCKKHTALSAVYVASIYADSSKDLVHKAKYASSRSAARKMGTLLEKHLPYLDQELVMVSHVPTTPSRVRERGFDQSLYVTQALCAPSKLLHAPLLRRLTNSHQVGSTRKERIRHMVDAFEVTKFEMVRGKTVLLVDDVLTTGATIEAAARAIKKAGAKRVLGAVFARVE